MAPAEPAEDLLNSPVNDNKRAENINSAHAEDGGPVNWWNGFAVLFKRCQNNNKNTTSSDIGGLNEKIRPDWVVPAFVRISASNSAQDHEIRLQLIRHIVDNVDGIPCVVQALEAAVKTSAAVDLSQVLRECTNPRNGNLRTTAVRTLIDGDFLEKLFKILAGLQEADSVAGSVKDDTVLTTINIVWVLSAMVQKDVNFVDKVRAMSKVKFFHHLTKQYFFGRHSGHYPFLKILRAFSKNKSVSLVLGKDKIMKLLQRIICTFNNQPSSKLMLAIDILSYLTLQKDNCHRFVKQGLVISIMRVFASWPLWRGNLVKFSKRILNIYSHLCVTYLGKKALANSEALDYLAKFCIEAPTDKGLDSVISKIVTVVYRALKKDALPMDDLKSAYTFEFPEALKQRLGRNNSSNSGASSSDEEEVKGDVEETDDEDDKDTADEEEQEDLNNNKVAESDDDEAGVEETAEDETPLKSDIPTIPKPKKHNNKPTSNNGGGDCIQVVQEFDEMSINKASSFFNEFGGNAANCDEWSSFFDDEYSAPPKMSVPTVQQKFFTSAGKDADPLITYAQVSNKNKSVVPFVKIAYPDFVMAYGARRIEYLNQSSDKPLIRQKHFAHISRVLQETSKNRLVYDLDALLASELKNHSGSQRLIGNNDEQILGKFDGKKENPSPQPLKFESRFESGNLRKAIQVAETEYDLYLNADVNCEGNVQWFYFQISNILENCNYTFNIVNCVKPGSQFNYGMQPVVFSVGDSLEGKPGWYRSGSQVCYFRNGYRNVKSKKRRNHYTASFTLNFGRRGDVCYVAYHYPYTYSRLLTELRILESITSTNSRVQTKFQVLCKTVNHNIVPVVSVTGNESSTALPIKDRKIIFLTARVHPGESNASWVMHGILHSLLSYKRNSEVSKLLANAIIKVVPMLNVEGVINGCHRCGLTSEDLNRRWMNPDEKLHPSIYWTKAMIEYSSNVLGKIPHVFCDLHGHSTRKNAFFFGCSGDKSWSEADKLRDAQNLSAVEQLPKCMSARSLAFSEEYCKYEVQRHREATARVALWRQYGISRSYTLESTYCGCDRGGLRGFSLGIHHLSKIGQDLVTALADVVTQDAVPCSGHGDATNCCPCRDSEGNDNDTDQGRSKSLEAILNPQPITPPKKVRLTKPRKLRKRLNKSLPSRISTNTSNAANRRSKKKKLLKPRLKAIS